MEKPEMGVPDLRGWRAEVGMLVPVGYMLREYEMAAPEGVRFSRAILGIGRHSGGAKGDEQAD